MNTQNILIKQASLYQKLLNFYIILIFITTYELKIFANSTEFLYLLYFLQNHTYCLYKVLTDIVVVDYPGKYFRFYVIYNLLSVIYNIRLRVILKVRELEPIPSLTSLYLSANWSEREVWDLYGVSFMNHLDLRRILTDYGFDGHPLRKDFPLTGFLEVFYDDTQKRIIYTPLSLAQSYKSYKYNLAWRFNVI